MTKKILINAAQQDEIRAALLDGTTLVDIDMESSSKVQTKANIYKATISRVEPSLDAVFVEYGSQKHGFLPAKDIADVYFNDMKRPNKDRPLKDAIKEGQELIIQVVKEERGTKGAAVTTYITLAGCYLVLMPNSSRGGGISRRISGEDRQQLKSITAQLKVPEGMSIISRTACLGRSIEELQWDLDTLLCIWDAILQADNKDADSFLIYQESDIFMRIVRDYLREDISEIIVDTQEAFDAIYKNIQRLRPSFSDRVKLHQDQKHIFASIEEEIQSAFEREISLPSGASIVIDHTEALTAIDINSKKATKGGNIEETATRSNIEAAKEIARQMRLRDLGGLIVIDFIDMEDHKNQKKVVNTLENAIGIDRARIQLSSISRFGLLELSRQRLRPSLEEFGMTICKHCNGQGSVRNTESTSIDVLRKVAQEVQTKNLYEVQVHVPVPVATYLMNEKRYQLTQYEQDSSVRIIIIPSAHMHVPEYEIKRIPLKKGGKQATIPSYKSAKKPQIEKYEYKTKPPAPKAAVQDIKLPQAPQIKEPSLFARICQSLFGDDSASNVATNTPSAPSHSGRGNNRRRNRNQHNRRRQGGGHNHEQRKESSNQNQGQTQNKNKQQHTPKDPKAADTAKQAATKKQSSQTRKTQDTAKTKPQEKSADKTLNKVATPKATETRSVSKAQDKAPAAVEKASTPAKPSAPKKDMVKEVLAKHQAKKSNTKQVGTSEKMNQSTSAATMTSEVKEVKAPAPVAKKTSADKAPQKLKQVGTTETPAAVQQKPIEHKTVEAKPIKAKPAKTSAAKKAPETKKKAAPKKPAAAKAAKQAPSEMEAMLAAEPKVNAAQEKHNLAKEKLSDIAPEPKKAPRKKASTKAKTAPKKDSMAALMDENHDPKSTKVLSSDEN